MQSTSLAHTPAAAERVLNSVHTVVVGMQEPLRIALAAIFAGGHVLFEDVPGLGKTVAARSLAAALGLDFRRLQCTPDLLPGDVTGSNIYDPKTGEFEFRPGPIFAGLLLADEINRTTPKTQSAMLEAMAERQVSVEGVRYPLPDPFHVIATSNPIEFEGTYALPEAQLDRFMVRLSVGYPTSQDEGEILHRRIRRQQEATSVPPGITTEELRAVQAEIETVHIDADVVSYAVALADATRRSRQVAVGASPRGSQGLILVARAYAAMTGRPYVRPDDLKHVAVPVLAHRLTLTPQAWAEGVSAEAIVAGVVGQVPVPAVASAS